MMSADIIVDLQYGDCAQQLAEVQESSGTTIHDFPEADLYGDLDNVAALISALDLVISVPNTNVHLAGALNVPVFHREPVGMVPNPDFITVMEAHFPRDSKLLIGCQTLSSGATFSNVPSPRFR